MISPVLAQTMSHVSRLVAERQLARNKDSTDSRFGPRFRRAAVGLVPSQGVNPVLASPRINAVVT